MTPHIIVLRRFYFTLLLLVATVVNVRAQFYPVQVTPQLVPPYSVYLSDYATPGSEKLRVIVLQRDLTQPAYQLRLVMSVEWNGKVIMRTSRAFTPPPINIDPGIPTVISGADLAPYLDSRNIDFVGYSRDQYEKTRALPEGSYRIFFTAYDYRRQDVQVSNEGSSFYYLSKNEPPLINFPACGTKIPLKTPQQIVFSWLPRNTASPNSVAETEYEFALYETRPAGRNPNDVVLSTQPVFRTRTDIPQLVYGPAEPVLLENMKYVWRVQAIDKNGRDAFRNNGFSEVCTFTYGGVDPTFDIGVVKNLQAVGETERRGKISWEAANYDSYKVYYKKTGTGYEWFSSDVKNTELKLFDLEPDTEYETRVQVRKSGVFGPYSEIVKFRTTPRRVLACGQDAGTLAQGDASKPLLAATRGMTIDVDGMEVMLLDVAPLETGWYKGMGTVTTKLLGASFHVKFDRLFIDDSHVAGFGKIEFLTKGVAELVQQQIANQQRKNNQKQQEENRSQWAGTDFQEKIFRYDNIVIADISFENGAMVITDAEGKTYENTEIPQLLVDAPEKAIIIEDKNGDQYVVQKDPTTGETKVTKVTGGGLPPIPGSNTVAREFNLKLKFIEAPLAKYGFDERKYDALAQDYEQLEGSYNVPWKAVATGATDGVTAKLDDNSIDKSKVRFELSSVSIPAPPLSGDQTTSVTVFGKGDGIVEELLALYNPTDTTQKEQVLGKLKVISYDKIVRNLVLISVNNTAVTVDAPTLQQELNKIYGQAAVQWQVRMGNALGVTYDVNNDGLEFGNSGIFSNYTSEMRTIINEYKRMDASAPANETYYLFFVPNASDQNVRGFMPRKKQMGFIFTQQLSGSNLIKTIGHELAHGAFRLEHTFPILPENGNNLLDRSTTGIYLHKYQWDLVHNPVAVLGLFEGDEEGALDANVSNELVQLLIDGIRDSNLDKKNRFNVSSLANKTSENFNIDLGDNQLSYLSTNVKSHLLTETNPTPLEINPSQKVKLPYTKEGGDKSYVKYVFNLLNESNDNYNPSWLMQSKNLVEFIIEKNDEAIFESYIYGAPLVESDEEKWAKFEFKNVDPSANFEHYKSQKNLFISSLGLDEDEDPLDYLSANLMRFEFLGETMVMHKRFAYALKIIKDSYSEADYAELSSNLTISNGFRAHKTTNGLSRHQLGMAIDINPSSNPMLISEDQAAIFRYIKLASDLDMYYKSVTLEQTINAQQTFKDRVLDKGITASKVKNSLTNIDLYCNDPDKFSLEELSKSVIESSLSDVFNNIEMELGNQSPNLTTLENEFTLATPKLAKVHQQVDDAVKILGDFSVGLLINITKASEFEKMKKYLTEKKTQIELIKASMNTNGLDVSELHELIDNVLSTSDCSSFLIVHNHIKSLKAWVGELGAFGNNLNNQVNAAPGHRGGNLFVNGFFNLPPEFSRTMENNNLIRWGGGPTYNSLKDWMHFEIDNINELLAIDEEVINAKLKD